MKKDGETVGIEDPKCPNHAMSAARNGLNMFAGEHRMYDPERKAREAIPVSVTRQKLKKKHCALEGAEQSRDDDKAQRNAQQPKDNRHNISPDLLLA